MKTFTFDEVTSLVAMLVGNLRSTGIEDGAYTLEQVSERTGFALTSLQKDCRAGKIKHVRYGDARAMTPKQLADFMRQHSTGGELAPRISPADDEVAQAREATRQSAAKRATPRGRAA